MILFYLHSFKQASHEMGVWMVTECIRNWFGWMICKMQSKS